MARVRGRLAALGGGAPGEAVDEEVEQQLEAKVRVEDPLTIEASDHAYERLIEPYRSELHAYCARMLGSAHEAEDAVQEALLRAWNRLPSFEGRSSFRSWLYRIATNTSLDAIARRSKRLAPMDYEASVESGCAQPWAPAHAWAEEETPEARVERRESLELAMAAALQLLPANQRAVLILREVLGFSAQETGEILGTTPTAVNSALQRARAALDRKPAEVRQARARDGAGEEPLRETVERYAGAWRRNDIDQVVSMLAEEVEFHSSGRSPALARAS